jgi:hypothetical protein
MTVHATRLGDRPGHRSFRLSRSGAGEVRT